MKYQFPACALLLSILFVAPITAQLASHAPTAVAKPSTSGSQTSAGQPSALQVSDKPVVKVNGVVLTDRDLVREMLTIFPYARQHNGFPKSQEAEIRQGALQMIIFEELVYQEAERRKLTISPDKIDLAEAEFRKQFNTPDDYQQYLQTELQGSRQKLRKGIQRSLLIEKVLKNDVENRSVVTLAEAQAYYDKNPGKFEQGESFTFQSISILPPRNPTPGQTTEGNKRAEEALKQAKATTSYEQFGLLAERISDDDFRVNMGNHKTVSRDRLPPQVLKAFLAMKSGQVSDTIQIEGAYTILRLNAHTPAGKRSFESVKAKLQAELQKQKYDQLRALLDKKLRSNAKVEVIQG
jgi:hypothetical protein